MVEIQRDHEATDGQTGKGLHHTARYGSERGPIHTKTTVDIVTDDGTVYRFSQLLDGEPFKFEPGDGSDNRVGRSGRLPGVVEAIAESEWTDDEGEPEPGWHY